MCNVNLVDLGKINAEKMTLWLQNSTLIQPRTSSPKFAEASKRYHPPVINLALVASLAIGKAGSTAQIRRQRVPVVALVAYDGTNFIHH